MLEIVNKTPFAVALHTALDKDCFDYVVVVIKALCSIKDGAELEPTTEKATIYSVNKYFGNPKTTSIEYAPEVVKTKLMTDVVVNMLQRLAALY